MSIYGFIPKDRWITREELEHLTGQSDRVNRREINERRKNPETLIISSSQRRGYKRPANVEEIEMCLNESRSRVKDEIEKQKVLEIAMRNFKRIEKSEQMEFDF